MRFLVVADDHALRQSLADAARSRGHEVVALAEARVEHGRDVAGQFDVVVLGWQPERAGALALCALLRSQPHGARLYILLATPERAAHQLHQALDAGANDYLILPITDDELQLRLAIAERNANHLGRLSTVEDLERDNPERSHLIAIGSDGYWDVKVTEPEWASPHNPAWYSLRFKQLLGYAAHEFENVLGSWLEALCPEDHQRVFAALRAHLEERAPYDVQYRLRTKRGVYRWFQARGQATWDDAGKVVRMAGTIHDITASVQAAEALRESEARYRLIADNVRDMIWIGQLMPQGAGAAGQGPAGNALAADVPVFRFTYVNPAFERLLGYKLEDLQAAGLEHLLSEESYARAMSILAEELAIDAEHPDPDRQRTVELEHRDTAGAIRWFETTSVFLRDNDGRPVGLIGVSRDIHERLLSERALRESEFRYRLLAENSTDMISRHSPDGRYLYASPACCTLLGYTPEQLVGSDPYEVFHPDDIDEVRRTHESLLQSADAYTVIYRIRRIDYRHVWVETTCKTIRDPATNEVQEIICVTRDVTERKKADNDLRHEQQILRQLLEVHERERQVIAYDIHDGFVQQLTASLMHLEACRHLSPQDPQRGQEEFDRGVTLLRNAVGEGRRLIDGLRPPILDESGIETAIEFLIGESHNSSLQIEFIHPQEFGRLAPPLQSAIFRIVQEALSNVRRHSHAQRARVQLSHDNNRVHVEIRDWGTGFDVDQQRKDSFGLEGIRHRARLLGGQAHIRSKLGEGTRILVDLPLVADSAAAGSGGA